MELPWHRRIRWPNVARLAAALGVVALVAAWPRLAPRPPDVPAGTAVPLAGGGAPRRREDPLAGDAAQTTAPPGGRTRARASASRTHAAWRARERAKGRRARRRHERPDATRGQAKRSPSPPARPLV